MKRVLCLVSAMNAGGAETFLMKIYRCIDRTKYQMDFCVNVEEEGLYDAEIKSMGGKIYYIPPKSKSMTAFSRNLYRVIHDNGYKNVMRITSNAMGFYDLHIAKKAGAVNRIARSSNSSDGGGVKPWLAHKIGKILYQRDVNVEIAPSDLAAIYSFGKRDFETGKVKILHNGISFDEYRFSEEKRTKIRKELCIDDNCFLMGHIGRFTRQKNHDFLIDVFAEVHKKYPNTKILLIGEGELKESVRDKCVMYNIIDDVIFAGVRKDVPDLLSAMDLFIFPSLYEGMPNVIIEAQAAGLRCLISDSITKQVGVTPLVEQIPCESKTMWVSRTSEIIDKYDMLQEQCERKESFLPKHYSIEEAAEQFVSYLI